MEHNYTAVYLKRISDSDYDLVAILIVDNEWYECLLYLFNHSEDDVKLVNGQTKEFPDILTCQN